MRRAEELLAEQLRSGVTKLELDEGRHGGTVGVASAVRAIERAQREAWNEATTATPAIRDQAFEEAARIERDAIVLGLEEVRACFEERDSDYANVQAAIDFIAPRLPEDAAQRLQDHMEQYHGICLSASEWDAAIRALKGTSPTDDGAA